jgi:hypothetical protein
VEAGGEEEVGLARCLSCLWRSVWRFAVVMKVIRDALKERNECPVLRRPNSMRSWVVYQRHQQIAVGWRAIGVKQVPIAFALAPVLPGLAPTSFIGLCEQRHQVNVAQVPIA